MVVKKFRAPTIGDALAMVRKSLGEDAVILRTRKVRKGSLLAFLAKELVEVIAASPDRAQLQLPLKEDQAARFKRGLEAHASAEIIRDLREEIMELKGQIFDLSQQVKYERMPSLPPKLAEHYRQMVSSGVCEELAKDLTQNLNLKFSGEELEKDGQAGRELSAQLASLIKVRPIVKTGKGRARVIALVGPTGVGKTTTLAKLVTSYRYWGKLDTALVSVDTYRVAAIEQLKTFAAIAGLPFEAVYQPASIKNVLARHHNRSAIFIDTAGRSQTDTERLHELAEFLTAIQPDEVLLCLSISTRLEEQLDIVQRYTLLNPSAIILTKLDECRGVGNLVKIQEKSKLPYAFLTCGQDVPNDILTAEANRLTELILIENRLDKLQRTHFQDWIDTESGRKFSGARVG